MSSKAEGDEALSFHFKKLEKAEQTKLKANRMKEIINITEIKEIENKINKRENQRS